MALLTAAQSKKTACGRRLEGHSSLVTGTARTDSAFNVVYMDTIEAAGSGQTTVSQHARRCFFSFVKPTAADYANANIGDKFCVFLADTSETTNPYDYEEWFKLQGGFGKTDILNVVDVVITAAEMLALQTTAKTLVAAPGAGKVVVPEGPIMARLGSGTTVYAGIAAGEDLVVAYDSVTSGASVVATLETTGFLDQTTMATAIAGIDGSAVCGTNQGLTMMLPGAITTGDIPVTVRVKYRVYDADGW